MAISILRIVSIVVSTLEAKNVSEFFDIFLTKKNKNSHLEQAKIV